MDRRTGKATLEVCTSDTDIKRIHLVSPVGDNALEPLPYGENYGGAIHNFVVNSSAIPSSAPAIMKNHSPKLQ